MAGIGLFSKRKATNFEENHQLNLTSGYRNIEPMRYVIDKINYL